MKTKMIKTYASMTLVERAKIVAYVVNRRRLRDRSMPTWANKSKINEIYLRSQELTRETGVKHEVDHIIPLQHPRVCGLHIPENLQILTKSENRKKSNYFE